MLIDQQVKSVYGDGTEYILDYPLPAGLDSYPFLDDSGAAVDISSIVKDLCMRAGFASGAISYEMTGLLYDPSFDKMTYMDAINELCAVSGFVFSSDEDGGVSFMKQSHRKPQKLDDTATLFDYDYTVLVYPHIVADSELVYSESNVGGTLY
jgi:hypothetical protein